MTHDDLRCALRLTAGLLRFFQYFIFVSLPVHVLAFCITLVLSQYISGVFEIRSCAVLFASPVSGSDGVQGLTWCRVVEPLLKYDATGNTRAFSIIDYPNAPY